MRIREDMKQVMKSKKGTNTHDWRSHFDLVVTGNDEKGWVATVTVKIAPKSTMSKTDKKIYTLPKGCELVVPKRIVMDNWKTTIEGVWSGAVLEVYKSTYFAKTPFKPRKKYKIKINLDVKGIDQKSFDQHYTIFCVRNKWGVKEDPLHQFDGTVNSSFWGVHDGAVDSISGRRYAAIAHEFGHLIGNPDEYNTVTFDTQTVTDRRGNVMHDVQKLPETRHFYMIANNIVKHQNLTKANCAVSFLKKRYKVTDNHPYSSIH